jgi:glutathione S-transferase
VESHHFYPAVADLVYELRVRPRLSGGAPPDPAVVDGLASKVADVLDVYEAHLAAGNRYLAGDVFTLADVNHMAQLLVMSLTPRCAELVAARPHLKAWWEDISARPAWKKTVEALNIPPP